MTQTGKATALALLVLAAGCDTGPGRAAVDDAERQPQGTASGMATGSDSAALTNMSVASDSAFLVRMIDHHHSLVEMAEAARTRGTAAVKRDAARLADGQRREIAAMQQALRESGGTHAPAALPLWKAMSDSLNRLSGGDHAATFYHHVVLHHEQGIAMMDSTAPHLRDADVRAMVDEMKRKHAAELKELRTKLAPGTGAERGGGGGTKLDSARGDHQDH